MCDLKRIGIPIIVVILLFIIMTLVTKALIGKECTKTSYYFNFNGKYIKADSQRFTSYITGNKTSEFTVGNITSNTKDYYKEETIGTYDSYGECK